MDKQAARLSFSLVFFTSTCGKSTTDQLASFLSSFAICLHFKNTFDAPTTRYRSQNKRHDTIHDAIRKYGAELDHFPLLVGAVDSTADKW